MSKLSEEIAAYETMRDELETDYSGQWVVVHGGQREGLYKTFEEAAKDAVRRFGPGPYLIRQIGAPPISLPASVLYRLGA